LPCFSKSLSDFDDDKTNSSSNSAISNKRKLVYLTSDATDVITSLDPCCAYIIGGIVDRNHHKGITYEKATQQGIATAKLPIREYLKMTGTHILTVNHVYEILLNFASTGSWVSALTTVVPERKRESDQLNDNGDNSRIGSDDETNNDEVVKEAVKLNSHEQHGDENESSIDTM
jgi:tRNA (guanine9-N1)-methyltransferase